MAVCSGPFGIFTEELTSAGDQRSLLSGVGDPQRAELGQLRLLDDTEFDSEAIRLSLVQLEQRGPGLIVDYQHLSGGQFISWVE